VTDPDLPLPADYPELLENLKRTVASSRWRAQRAVNTELLGLYWRMSRVPWNFGGGPLIVRPR